VTHRRLAGTAGGLAALGLALVWWMAPGGPALYDGLPIGTPPYRYLDPPSGAAKTPPPSTVSARVVLADNPSGATLATKEPIPQCQGDIPTQLLIVPAGVTEVNVTVGPVPPPATPPPDGRIDGNVCRIAVESPTGQPLAMRPGAEQLFGVEMRGTGSQREPYVEHYAAGTWTRIPFVHPKPGIFQFQPPQPGEWALVLPPDHSVFGPGLTAAVAIGGSLVVIGAVLAAVRRRRLAGAAYDGEDTDGEE
jgi:hypothetical protein